MKKDKQVYVSYAWKVEDQNNIVKKLAQACQQRGLALLRDKNELAYRDSIPEYMDKLAAGDAIILVLSEAYFKSAYCMYELCTAFKREDFHQSIFPVVVSGTSFNKTIERTPYIRYWENKKKELGKDLKTVDMENLGSSSHVELKEYVENCRIIDDLLTILGDMNTLTEGVHIETDFKALLDLIQPLNQRECISKPKRQHQSDQQFCQKIAKNIQKILEQQTNLCDALKAIADENNHELEKIVDQLCKMEFETAIDDYLYPATKDCLSQLESSSMQYTKTWEAAKTILGWSSLLVVREEWVAGQEKLIIADDLSFTVQVATATGIEVASARFRQLQPKLKAISGKADVVGQESILPPQLNSGWGNDMPLQRILVEIWNKVFPEDTRQVAKYSLSKTDLGNLDNTLKTREKRKTHHYYIPVPKNQNIAAEILKELPSITIIYLESSDTEPTLRVENEGQFTSIIREFLTMNNNARIT